MKAGTSPGKTSPDTSVRGRAILFFVVLAFICWGPFYRQVLGGRFRLFRQWTMFTGMASGLVDARFYRVDEEGRRQAIDRFTALGYERRADAPGWVWRIKGRAGLLRIEQALREKLGRHVEVVSEARMATPAGWRTLASPASATQLTNTEQVP